MIDQYPPANGVLTSLIWRKTAAGGETSLSGYDNASQALSYTPGQEQVYLNGILLVRGDDYTATNGTSITGLTALAAGDFVQVNCYNNFSVASVPTTSLIGTVSNAQLANSSITINGNAVSLGGSVSLPGDIESVTASSPLTGGGTSGAVTIGIQSASTTQSGAVQLSDSTSTISSVLAATPTAVKSAYDLANGAIQKTLTTTTGDIIYASSANTPSRLGIGSTGQVLSVSEGIPAWSTPSGGSTAWTNIGSTQTTGSTSYTFNFNDYEELWFVGHVSTTSQQRIKVNLNNYDPTQNEYSNFTTIYRPNSSSIGGLAVTSVDDRWKLNDDDNNIASANLRFMMKISGCNKSTGFALAEWWCAGEPASPGGYVYYNGNGIFSRATKITSLRIFADDTFDVVNIRLYGRK